MTEYKYIGAAMLIIGSIISTPSFAQMAPAPDEVQVGPIDIPQSIQGVPVTVKATSYMSVSTSPAGLAVRARMFANLTDLYQPALITTDVPICVVRWS